MKKISKLLIIISIAFIFLIIAYFINPHNSTDEPVETETVTAPIEEKYVDTNPIKLGIYDSKRNLVTKCTNKWTYHKDILEYNIFYTQDTKIDTSRIPICFDKYAALYSEDVSSYRIGFNVKFSIGDTEINKTIISPNDVEDFYDYLEIYLYDGYHRKAGEWYSHTVEEEFNESTLFTGIKLTAGVNVKEITSDIILTTFSYNSSDDFDENGFYRGISSYSITVINGEIVY